MLFNTPIESRALASQNDYVHQYVSSLRSIQRIVYDVKRALFDTRDSSIEQLTTFKTMFADMI